jgi:hypothetical protein
VCFALDGAHRVRAATLSGVVMGIVRFGSRARKRKRWCALRVVWEVMIGR